MAQLRRVEPTRPAGRFARLYAVFSATALGRAISRYLAWKVDPLLLRLTGGRVASTLVFPTGVLETRGARSGALRRNAVIYFHDGDRVTIVASKAGAPTHPGWYFNLVAHPEVTFGGVPMLASVVTDQGERDRLWAIADLVFPVFPRYRRDAARAGRTIPVVQLTPRSAVRGDER